MNVTLIVALALAWTAIAVLFGVLIGNSIHLADLHEDASDVDDLSWIEGAA